MGLDKLNFTWKDGRYFYADCEKCYIEIKVMRAHCKKNAFEFEVNRAIICSCGESSKIINLPQVENKINNEPVNRENAILPGWNSSYSGEPIPQDQMQEWVSGTVSRIKELQPKNLLEIGCGTGLLLYRYAPVCDFFQAIERCPEFKNSSIRSRGNMST